MSVFHFLGTTLCQICPPRNSTPKISVRLFCYLPISFTTPFELLFNHTTPLEFLFNHTTPFEMLFTLHFTTPFSMQKREHLGQVPVFTLTILLVFKNLKTWVKFHPPTKVYEVSQFYRKIGPIF